MFTPGSVFHTHRASVNSRGAGRSHDLMESIYELRRQMFHKSMQVVLVSDGVAGNLNIVKPA